MQFMTGVPGLITFLVILVLVVLISQFTKCNIGLVGLVGAYILGVIFCNYSSSQIAGFFPSSIFLTQLTVTFFFGFIGATGVFKSIGDRVVYRCRNMPWAVPIITAVAGYVVGALGAGNEATPLVISPLAFAFAAEAGFNPVIAAMAVYGGSCWGGSLPWTSGAMLFGFCETALGPEDGNTAMWVALIGCLIVFIIMFLFAYFFFGGHKTRLGVNIKKPEPFQPMQKKVLALLILYILVLVLPSIINTWAPNAACTWIAQHMDIRVCSLIGSLVCLFLKVHDPREVLMHRVPWGLLSMLAGMCTLMNVAASMGVVDLMGNWLGSSVPAAMIPAALVMLGGLLSFVTNGLTLWPFLTSMAPALAAASGLSPTLLCACAMTSCWPSGFSPISTGGAMATIGADDDTRSQIFWRQMAVSGVGVVVNVLFALVGIYSLIDKLIA